MQYCQKKQGHFNYRQSRTRMVVEEAYGQSLRKNTAIATNLLVRKLSLSTKLSHQEIR